MAEAEAIIADINSVLSEVWQSAEHAPNTIIMPARTCIWLMRGSMTKRRFRRWRGKFKAHMRRERRRVTEEWGACTQVFVREGGLGRG